MSYDLMNEEGLSWDVKHDKETNENNIVIMNKDGKDVMVISPWECLQLIGPLQVKHIVKELDRCTWELRGWPKDNDLV